MVKLKAVTIGQEGYTLDDILVHDAKREDPYLHLELIKMGLPEMPVAFGVIRAVDAPVYDQEMEAQIKTVQSTSKIKCVDDLLNSGHVWKVE